MNYNRPIVISIAGFDPSGGAGVLADVKTFEQNNCLGMAVVSALTVQTEDTFVSVKWLSSAGIIEQLRPLLEAYDCQTIKIGIIESLKTVSAIVEFIHSQKKDVKIIWDTVLAASSGFDLIRNIDKEELRSLLRGIYLITPNTNEAKKLTGYESEIEAAKYLSESCNVLLKGGHSTTAKGTDKLYHAGRITDMTASPGSFYSKHGSGCILSAAIASELALGNDLEDSCRKAKTYIEKILNSNPQLLAYHA